MKKNEETIQELKPVAIYCLNKLDKLIINKFLAKEEYHLIYTTQDQLDPLFTNFSNNEKEK
jgi:hypothetical protein